VPIRTKVDGKQPKGSSPQVKVNKTNTSQASKRNPHAPQSSFYADYVLTWDRNGKVVAKYDGPRTKSPLVKRNVWVPKVLVTNTLGPNCRCLTPSPSRDIPEVVDYRWGVVEIRNSKVQGTQDLDTFRPPRA
jgi:hypothetical protein